MFNLSNLFDIFSKEKTEDNTDKEVNKEKTEYNTDKEANRDKDEKEKKEKAISKFENFIKNPEEYKQKIVKESCYNNNIEYNVLNNNINKLIYDYKNKDNKNKEKIEIKRDDQIKFAHYVIPVLKYIIDNNIINYIKDDISKEVSTDNVNEYKKKLIDELDNIKKEYLKDELGYLELFNLNNNKDKIQNKLKEGICYIESKNKNIKHIFSKIMSDILKKLKPCLDDNQYNVINKLIFDNIPIMYNMCIIESNENANKESNEK